MTVQILGILNVTSDSFSDGGLFLEPRQAVLHGQALCAAGAHILDVGAVSSNPAGRDVSIEEEIRRLDSVVPELIKAGLIISVDSFRTPVQRHALRLGVSYLNDIAGFEDTSFFPELASANVKLIVMHSIQRGRATEEDVSPDSIAGRLFDFFDERIAALEAGGIARDRIILDPGMGFFLGRNPACSFAAISLIPDLRKRYNLPILASVSRKSFLGAVTGRDVADRGAATLAAEIACIERGASYLRSHRPDAIADAIRIFDCLRSARGN